MLQSDTKTAQKGTAWQSVLETTFCCEYAINTASSHVISRTNDRLFGREIAAHCE